MSSIANLVHLEKIVNTIVNQFLDLIIHIVKDTKSVPNPRANALGVPMEIFVINNVPSANLAFHVKMNVLRIAKFVI